MSLDRTPFKAPEKYPEPPTGMYYEVPKTPTYQKPAPIFPWEKYSPKPTRVFAEDNDYIRLISSGSTITDEKDEPVTPVDLWQSFNLRGNSWDDIPEIERYIRALQKNRKGNIQVLQGYGSGIPQNSSPGGRRPSMKLTDFPTELERPSLPVTPAPVRRPSFWGYERDEDGELPAAEGVPAQTDWVGL
jgi:glycogenin glucosyltransferase